VVFMIAHVVNPGSSSVKLACASVLPSENAALPGQLQVALTRAEVALPGPPGEQNLEALTRAVLDATADWPFPDALVARGGWLGQVAAGTYRVARRAAHEVGKRLQDARVVVAHLGATTSVTAFDRGRAIDTTGTGPDGGPLGALQAGPLPASALLRLAEGRPPAEVLRQLARTSGFLALTGSADLRELEAREQGDPAVQAAVAAFVHQACKAIGEQCAALPARPDALALTGGVARWDAVVDRIERRVAWIAPVIVVPGELELEALAEGVGRVLLGLETAREWTPPVSDDLRAPPAS
jgi:butyrate kinase